jgi:polysaccharide biosynthesis/export protein
MRLFLAAALIATAGAQPQRPPTPMPESANLPVQAIGPQDLITVSIYDAPELSRSVRVSAEGMIRMPMLRKKIQAQGVLPVDLEGAIAEAFEEEGVLVDPVVTVTVSEYHSRPVSVAGAVRTPVTFQAIGRVTLLEAIARAGGLDKDAGAEILVTACAPNDSSACGTQHIPVKKLIDAPDAETNLALHGGEEIRIPQAGKIFVVGNVKKPGAFLAQEDAEWSVLKAIAMGEGLLPFTAHQAFVYRPNASGGKREIAVDLQNIMNRKSPDVSLAPNDVLYVPDNKNRRLGAAALERILIFGSTAGATALIYGH